MALPNDVEMARQRMQQAQEALLKYVQGNVRNPELHKKLIQDVRNATADYLDRIARLE
jgi:hypothetical protein